MIQGVLSFHLLKDMLSRISSAGSGSCRMIGYCHQWLSPFLTFKILIDFKHNFRISIPPKVSRSQLRVSISVKMGLEYNHMELNKHFALFYFCEIRKNDEADSLYLYL